MRPFITATTLCLFLLTPANSQQSTGGARLERSGLSALMIATQLQHIKLWFAGKFKNWKLAAYELDQLEAGLRQAVMSVPPAGDPDAVAGLLSLLRKSIEGRDIAAFTKSYTELTYECNACHRAAGRDFIGVQIPPASPFTDQVFPDQAAEGRALADSICATCHVVPDRTSTVPSPGVAAPSFSELVHRPGFSGATLRQLLSSSHRRVGPEQAMLNPRLTENQIEQIVAFFEVLKAGQGP